MGSFLTDDRIASEEIGEGLRGWKARDTITVTGPCGAAHTMSLQAAAKLRDWLSEKLGGPPTIDVGAVDD